MLTLFEKSVNGRKAYTLPYTDVTEYSLTGDAVASTLPQLPELAEVDVVRHYTELSTRAFGVDNGFYPLGSCTMKYNPKINEVTASLKGFTDIHPLCGSKYAQGALELMYNLSGALSAITGMPHFSLTPAAGAHGEYLGLKLIRSYHRSRGDFARTKIIVPDSAHGTNPASATLNGLTIVNIPSTADGSVDLDALQGALGDDVAGLMLTNPNTLGLFDKNIARVTTLVHESGGLCYYDGANLNAVMGVARPADMGFDVVHLNLHKTFSTPHGGGGPGSGPVGCVDKLAEFLPSPIIVKEGDKFEFSTPANSCGSVKAFYGNFLVMVKAYTYILSLGAEGIKNAAQLAVLNANYLKALLRDVDFRADRLCMHEFVLSLEDVKARTGVSALDIAKAMIDAGMHPPTMYFPLIVHEALMFEPTETESKETLDDAAHKVLDIIARADTAPEKLHSAPLHAPISRPDEVGAARNPVLKFSK